MPEDGSLDSGSAGERPVILCASTQYWDEAWFRKQHFMHRLAAHRDVIYIEPSFSLLRRPAAQCPPGQANPFLLPRMRQRGERLWTFTPPRGRPFWTHPAVSRGQYRWYGTQLRRAAKSHGYERTWLWLYNPLYIQAVPTLRPERVIFDLVDDLSAYDAAGHSRRNMGRCMEEALARADLVFTTSEKLARQYAATTRTGRMHVVSNGVRAEWIERVSDAPPAELAGLPRPLIGVVGALFSYLDYDLLTEVAREFSTGSLVCVGPELHPPGVERLRALRNVHLIGRRPQGRIPEFLQAFDVCLSPFLAGAVRRAVNPLKVYEYLAAGRPVVSTPLESLVNEPVARWIRFAEGTPQFLRAIHEALIEDTEAVRRERREAVRPYTWEALGERVESVLEEYEAKWREEGRAGGIHETGPAGT